MYTFAMNVGDRMDSDMKNKRGMTPEKCTPQQEGQ